MKKTLPLFLLLSALVVTTVNAQISASISGSKQVTLDCKNSATVDVSYTGNYVASALGGALILDPSTGDEVPILVTNAASFEVRTSFGSGKIFVADPANSSIIDSVEVNVTNLSTLIGNITQVGGGGECMPSDGSIQLTVDVDPRAINDVEYSWAVIRGREHTTIDPTTRNSQTITINSLNAGTSFVRVTVTNDCSGEFCASPSRTFRIRKVLSAAERASVSIAGADCTSDDVLGQDNLIVLSVPPVLGRWDVNQYAWDESPAGALKEEFRSADGSAIAYSVLDNSQDITVSLNLGPECNPGLTYTQVLKAPPPVPQIGVASNGFSAETTFCLPEENTTQETFRILNNPNNDFQYDWIIPAAWQLVSTDPSNTEVTVTLANNSPGTITVRATNDGCGDELATININRFPSVAPPIIAPSCLSFGSTDNIDLTVAGGDNTYNWDVQVRDAVGNLTPANWTPVDPANVNGATIRYIPDFTGVSGGDRFFVTAEIVGNCGNNGPVISELELPIGPAAPTQASITLGLGADVETVMNGGSSCFTEMQEYILDVNSVDFADEYEWSITGPMDNGWAFRTSQNAQLTRVTAGHQPVTISVIAKASGCADSEVLSFTANINPAKPQLPVITQTECITPTASSTVTLEVPDDLAVITYDWNADQLPGISIIGGNGRNVVQLEVGAGADITQAITVTATNAGGCSVTSDGLTLTYGEEPNSCTEGEPLFISTLIAISFLEENNEYEWYSTIGGIESRVLDGMGNPLNAQSFVEFPRASDEIRVVITGTNGCKSEFILPNEIDQLPLCSPTAQARLSGLSDSGFINDNQRYVVSPNPANTFIQVRRNDGQEINRVYLVNMEGKTALQKNVYGTNQSIDTVDVPPGMYYLIIEANDGNHFHKVIIKK